MAFEDLREKILGDARGKADAIIKEAQAEAESVLDKAKQEQEHILAAIRKEAGQAADERYRNIVTTARGAGRNKILETRQSLVNGVYAEVYNRMTRMTAEQFRAFALNVLKQYPPGETVRVMVGTQNSSMVTQDFLDNVADSTGASGRFVLVQNTRNFGYGFYLLTEWMEIDLTFPGILRSIREQTEMQVISTLFGKDNQPA